MYIYDIQIPCTNIDTFHTLEAGVFDPVNEIDIFCLHFVFLQRINKCLDDFHGSWNCHPLSTEGNMSPLQLFVEGVCESSRYDGPQSDSALLGPSPNLTPEQVETVDVPLTNLYHAANFLLDLHHQWTPCLSVVIW